MFFPGSSLTGRMRFTCSVGSLLESLLKALEQALETVGDNEKHEMASSQADPRCFTRPTCGLTSSTVFFTSKSEMCWRQGSTRFLS